MIVKKAGKRLISYTVFNSDDTLMLNKPYIGDMDLIKHDSEQREKKLIDLVTLQAIGQVIKGDLTETNNNRKSPRTKPENKESVT